MHAAHVITLDCTPATPWRNGGGITRELLARPSLADWRLRISVADITTDGPFSAFPGVQRWFTLLSGQGVTLNFSDRSISLRTGDTPLTFDGAEPPGCRLIGGPVRDLNLMVRGGTGGMAAITPAEPWQPPAHAQAGLFVRTAGHWRVGGHEFALPALSLLWFDAPLPGDWHFESTSATPEPAGWWLYHSPEDVCA